MALEDVENAVDDLVAGEVRVVGGHGPREPPRQGVGLGRRSRRGERRRQGGGEADVAEDRRTERRRRHFLVSLPVRFGFDLAGSEEELTEFRPTLVLGSLFSTVLGLRVWLIRGENRS